MISLREELYKLSTITYSLKEYLDDISKEEIKKIKNLEDLN